MLLRRYRLEVGISIMIYGLKLSWCMRACTDHDQPSLLLQTHAYIRIELVT